MDFGIACDYACAAAWELNMENRIEGTIGSLAKALGYIDDCTAVFALPLGPVREFWYYNRPTMSGVLSPENQVEMLRNNMPNHWMMFAGDLRPPMKGENWWMKQPEYLSVGTDEAYTESKAKNAAYLLEAVMAVRPKVEEMKQKMNEKTESLRKK